MRIGPKMKMAADYVAANPGVSFRKCAHFVSPHPDPVRNEALGYDIVWRAVNAGLVVVQRGKRGRVLFPPQVAE